MFLRTLPKYAVELMEGMVDATDKMADGDFTVRVDESRDDVLGDLGRSINHMAARLESYVNGQKRFLSDIAHELSSPIARIQLAMGILEQVADDRSRSRVERALKEIDKLSQLVNEILSFRKSDMGDRPMDLQPICLRDAVEAAMESERKEGAVLVNEVPGHLHVQAIPQLLVRALANLLRNAVRYARDAGPIKVVAKLRNDRVVVEIRDKGPGVSPESLEDLFRPFFREDPSRNRDTGGVGLGMAIVANCVKSCKGTVVARNRASGGFAVTISLLSGPPPGP